VNTPPRNAGLSAQADLTVNDDPLLGTDGRVWPALLRLWTYSTVSGVCALGLGQAMVSITHTVLPASPVRLSSMIVVVLAAGLLADYVLGQVKKLTSRNRS
jgi:hypothetical protein